MCRGMCFETKNAHSLCFLIVNQLSNSDIDSVEYNKRGQPKPHAFLSYHTNQNYHRRDAAKLLLSKLWKTNGGR